MTEPQFLYLTTTGRLSGQPHTIEIWFVTVAGNLYLVSEMREQSHWVRNIAANPAVRYAIGRRDADWTDGVGRILDPTQEPELAAGVRSKMDAKYGWSDGLIVEIQPVR
jgi:deazaflavin-dependent oxidoreductase (nitroreductase family)